ncbi:MAG: redox-sensing transcriptional repressor Rex [Hydrogenoanaerobacterium sp.]
MTEKPVSISVVRRLPRYHRFLGELLKNDVHRISSRELSLRMGLTASQIRQDLNCFGGFGQQGYGYNVEALYNEIGHILGLDRCYKTILIGVGNLGRAVANHMPFDGKGYRLIGLFDNNRAIVGEIVRNIVVNDMDSLQSFCKKYKPEVAILCTPRDATQHIADTLVELGVRGFWNYSHYDITMNHPQVAVENVHLSDSLMTLCYKVNNLPDQQ